MAKILYHSLSFLAALRIPKTLRGKLTPVHRDQKLVSYSPRGKWDHSNVAIYNRIHTAKGHLL
uniref:Uncharacterized protein n=1 Tax=Arundo donax TaxID=35708 RepID=A0A0A9EIT9_ARUDO